MASWGGEARVREGIGTNGEGIEGSGRCKSRLDPGARTTPPPLRTPPQAHIECALDDEVVILLEAVVVRGSEARGQLLGPVRYRAAQCLGGEVQSADGEEGQSVDT